METVIESTLPAVVQSVPKARRVLREALEDRFDRDLLERAELVVSELVTNAIIHAGTDVTVRLQHGDQTLRLEVSDRSRRLVSPRRYADTAGTGRGLQLVESSADRWGVEQTSAGKTVWVEFGSPFARVDAAGEVLVEETAVHVVLRHLPLLMHWAWQEHAQALLREHLLYTLDQDPSAIDQHAQASEALAILHEQVPQPLLPDDPDALLAESLDPDMTAEEVVIRVPISAVARFATLNLVLGRAIEAASQDLFLGPPTQPEIEEMREWLCEEVARQATGGPPAPWRTRADVQTPLRIADDLVTVAAPLTRGAADLLVTNEASVIVAASARLSRRLGYATPHDLVGRRVILVVPSRYHQAHIAGTTLNATNGRDRLLDEHLQVPLVRADGSELEVGLMVRSDTIAGTRVFVAEVVLPPEGGPGDA